jgi:phytoene desaturase
LLLNDIRDLLPRFRRARDLAWDITAHEWPARRAITGHDLPIETQSGTCGM